MPIAPSQSLASGIQASKAGALNPRLSTSMVLSVDISSIEADGAHVTLSAAISKAFFSNPPGPMPAPEHTAPTGYPHDWHEWAPGYEPQPGYEKQPTGSGTVTFYNSGLGTTLKSVTDNIARVTTADPHGFTAGMHIGIMVGLAFDPVNAAIIETGAKWFTFDARPIGDAGPDVPDVAEAAFIGTVMPVLGGSDIDTTGTWDIDNPASASPQAVYSLTLPIGVVLSDSWPSVNIDCRLNIITAYYGGTVDWQPCLQNVNIFWPDSPIIALSELTGLPDITATEDIPDYFYPLSIPDLHDYEAGASNLDPRDTTTFPLMSYPRHWGPFQGAEITVTKDSPATLKIKVSGYVPDEHSITGQREMIIGGSFVKSDGYDQNPIGEYTCTGGNPGFGYVQFMIDSGVVIHVIQREPWTMHASDLSALITGWPNPLWHYRTMRLFVPPIYDIWGNATSDYNFNGDWFPRVDSDSDYTGALYIKNGSFSDRCSLIIRRGNAAYSTSVFGYFVKSDSDLTNPVGAYTCGGYGPGGFFAGTVLTAGGVIHVTSG